MEFDALPQHVYFIEGMSCAGKTTTLKHYENSEDTFLIDCDLSTHIDEDNKWKNVSSLYLWSIFNLKMISNVVSEKKAQLKHKCKINLLTFFVDRTPFTSFLYDIVYKLIDSKLEVNIFATNTENGYTMVNYIDPEVPDLIEADVLRNRHRFIIFTENNFKEMVDRTISRNYFDAQFKNLNRYIAFQFILFKSFAYKYQLLDIDYSNVPFSERNALFSPNDIKSRTTCSSCNNIVARNSLSEHQELCKPDTSKKFSPLACTYTISKLLTENVLV